MDRSNEETHGRPQSHATTTTHEGRRSLDPNPRLQKKRSVRNAASGPPRSSEGYATGASAPLAPAANGGAATKARKGSLRDAVRRIFARQPRDVQSPPQRPQQRSSPPRTHQSHYSEPAAGHSSPGPPEVRTQTASDLPNPLRSSPITHLPRISSPSTSGAFPNSVKLKPLDLGNPQIRRRKTLPNVQLTELEAATIASSPLAAPPIPPTGASRDMAALDTSLGVRTSKEAKRRSRSAGDLRKSAEAASSTARNRKDEIKYWRESFQPPPLRGSDYASSSVRTGGMSTAIRDVDNASATRGSNLFETTSSRPGTANLRSSPPDRRGMFIGDVDVQSASNIGTEMSSELEDRVAKLEAGLHNFQRSLLRLTADRNRRTVIVGSESSPRSARDTRTPSMLADTLHGPFQPSSYEFEYGFNTRQPLSSPPQRPAPQTPQRLDDPFGPDLPVAAAASPHDEAFLTPSSRDGQQPPPIPGSSHSNSQTPEYTFRSLYQMLNDERSARKRLESQLKGLRSQITDLSSQMASSTVQSQRSSYIHMDSTSGSRRLRELLDDTESSPPGTSQGRAAQRGFGSAGEAGGQAVVSRFSASESEAGAEELPTPHEAYQTPREARSMYNLGGERGSAGDGEMF